MIDIKAEHLPKRYMLPPGGGRRWRRRQAFWALKDVNFGVRRGEALGIIGPNGSGKSTLVKLFSRITAPSEGTITLNGCLSALIELGAGFRRILLAARTFFSAARSSV